MVIDARRQPEKQPVPDFPQQVRLRTAAEFDRVFARRRSRSDRWIVLYACENHVGYPRLGLVVSRKCGTAVRRNRWKRCLREAFRQSQEALPAGLDLVVIPRPQADPSTPQLAASLRNLAASLAKVLAAEGRP